MHLNVAILAEHVSLHLTLDLIHNHVRDVLLLVECQFEEIIRRINLDSLIAVDCCPRVAVGLLQIQQNLEWFPQGIRALPVQS